MKHPKNHPWRQSIKTDCEAEKRWDEYVKKASVSVARNKSQHGKEAYYAVEYFQEPGDHCSHVREYQLFKIYGKVKSDPTQTSSTTPILSNGSHALPPDQLRSKG